MGSWTGMCRLCLVLGALINHYHGEITKEYPAYLVTLMPHEMGVFVKTAGSAE